MCTGFGPDWKRPLYWMEALLVNHGCDRLGRSVRRRGCDRLLRADHAETDGANQGRMAQAAGEQAAAQKSQHLIPGPSAH